MSSEDTAAERPSNERKLKRKSAKNSKPDTSDGDKGHNIPVSLAAMLVTLGVVYGDIGTSPMYVTKALLAGQGGIMQVTEELILGALSLVIWTVTLLTTVKYVLVSLKAGNHGEGGISPCTASCANTASGSSYPPCSAARPCLPMASSPRRSPSPPRSRACAPSPP